MPEPDPTLVIGVDGAFTAVSRPDSPKKTAVPSVARITKRCRRKRSIVWRLTIAVVKCYSLCNQDFKYERASNPRRVLIKPSIGTCNGGFDNANSDLIVSVNDILESENEKPARRFRVIDLVGHGTFGQVLRCVCLQSRRQVAIKVIKNTPAYYNQAFMEIRLLKLLNDQFDPKDEHHIVRLQDNFMFKNHLCLAFEVLSMSLYDALKLSNHQGFPMKRIQTICSQMLKTLVLLRQHRIIHCDLKPENVLLSSKKSSDIKVIDFGSACFDYQTVYSYIQSRFYRAPEILLQIPYNSAIDVWSLGCIAAELYTGLPLFPGVDEFDQMRRIVAICGPPPISMLREGLASSKFAHEISSDSHDPVRSAENRITVSLREAFARRRNETDHECFIDFISGLLPTTPQVRWTPIQAASHPFITGRPWSGPFLPVIGADVRSVPQMILKRNGPPKYSYSGHRFGGGQAGSASGEIHPRDMMQALQRMSLTIPNAPYVRLSAAPVGRRRRGSAHIPPAYSPLLSPGSDHLHSRNVNYSPMISPYEDYFSMRQNGPAFSPLPSPGGASAADWDPFFNSSDPIVSSPCISRQRRSSLPSNPYIDQYSGPRTAGAGEPLRRPNPWL
uniref:Protein kinase domain-containing protein n=1 Tax=Spongospora subterranea TaxID=70186 RepID=A0A0H5R929_9EUKA|eukprot:CRZ10212.1 hypothetical protein [Spongospora subterranea]